LRVALEDLDTMAPLESNAQHGVRSAPGAELLILASVDHYSFIGRCGSHRLRARLMALYMERGRPSDDEWIIGQSWEKDIRDRIAAAAKSAKVRRPKVKDLRDTYASTWITHGIVLRWISFQLGHGSLSVTERHYLSYMAHRRLSESVDRT